MKNPYDTEDPQELQEIASYWLQKCNQHREDYVTLVDAVLDKGWNITISEIRDARKRVARRDNERELS